MKHVLTILLFLICSATPTVLNAQCDSAISVCPKVFSRLILADVQVQSYKQENHALRTEINLLSGVIEDQGEAIKNLNSASDIDRQIATLFEIQLTKTEDLLKKERKRSARLK